MAHAIVDHRAAPHRELRGGHQARGVRPVLEQHALAVGEALELRAVEDVEAAPEREQVRALEHVDGVELDASRVLGEALEGRGPEYPAARPVEVLALEEQRRDRMQGDGPRAHAPPATG